jgi:hypothetical protein
MMTKKKYFKTVKRNCKNHKCKFCTCQIAGHRYWMSKKYWGKDDGADGDERMLGM